MASLRSYWHVLTDDERASFLIAYPERVWELDPLWVVNHNRLHHLSDAVNTVIKTHMVKLNHNRRART